MRATGTGGAFSRRARRPRGQQAPAQGQAASAATQAQATAELPAAGRGKPGTARSTPTGTPAPSLVSFVTGVLWDQAYVRECFNRSAVTTARFDLFRWKSFNRSFTNLVQPYVHVSIRCQEDYILTLKFRYGEKFCILF